MHLDARLHRDRNGASLPVVLRSFSDKFPHVHIKLIIRTPAEQLNGVLNNHIDRHRQLQLAGA